jgi:hypothetical protein
MESQTLDPREVFVIGKAQRYGQAAIAAVKAGNADAAYTLAMIAAHPVMYLLDDPDYPCFRPKSVLV